MYISPKQEITAGEALRYVDESSRMHFVKPLMVNYGDTFRSLMTDVRLLGQVVSKMAEQQPHVLDQTI
jgi:hypothetical protein